MTRKADIERLLRSGRRVRARLLDVRTMDSPAGHPRVAILVPRLGFSSVRRNKLKRQLREIARLEVLPRSESRDLLFRAKREAYSASFPELHADMARATTLGEAGSR